MEEAEQQQAADVADTTTTTTTTPMDGSLHPPMDMEEDEDDVLNLLEVSQFLNINQSYFTFHTIGPILLQDLQQVVRYRALKKELKHWKEQASIYSTLNNDQGGSSSTNPYQAKINECHEKLAPYQPKGAAALSEEQQQQQENDAIVRLLKIDKLWRRMQVWTCKALAQHVLVAQIPNAPRDLQTHLWSYPLSMPLASYASRVLPLVKDVKKDNSNDKLLPFAKIFDDTYNNAHSNNNIPNGLLIPPSHSNWQEYTRLCSMMAQLPNDRARQAVHLSPLALNARSYQHVCQVKFKWHPTDLVALWMRAQRSPQAQRHLVQLFQVTPINETDNDDKDNGIKNNKYRAEFKGNHRLVYKRSILCSPLADKICTLSMVNQVMCTYPQFVKHWQEQAREEQGAAAATQAKKIANNRKRRRPPGGGGDSKNVAKQRRKESPSDYDEPAVLGRELRDDEQIDLWYDCEEFLLRTWARRHAKDLTLLCQHDWQVQQPALVDGGTLRAHLKKHLPKATGTTKTSDYSLLRIERRIRKGKYSPPKNVSLSQAVTGLVQEFCRCLVNEKERRRQAQHENDDDENFNLDDLNAMVARLKRAQDEFAASWEKLASMWNETGAIAAARSLMAWTNEASTTYSDSSSASSANAVEAERAILSSAPAPWHNICVRCKDVVKEKGSYRTCTCCEQVYHDKCRDQNDDNEQPHKGLKSFISTFAPLKDLFLVRAPSANENWPNYCGHRASEIEWTTTKVTLTRTYDAPTATTGLDPTKCKLESWGLKFFDSRSCAKHIDDVEKGDVPIWKWNETKGPMLRIEPVGVIVSNIFDGTPSARSSLQVGDVIIAVRVGASDSTGTAAGDEKFSTEKNHTLAEFAEGEYMCLFQQRSMKLDLVIQRPNRPIVVEAEACLDHMVKAMEIPLAVLDKIKSESLHFCRSCRSGTGTTTPPPTRTAREDIRNCKAVIRRLGSEWYGPSFWYEDHVRAERIMSLDGDREEESQANAELHAQCVSLGRLDCMMDELLDREEEDHATGMDENESMAFSIGTQHLEWVSPDLGQSPMALLCRGMSLILNDYQKSPSSHDIPQPTPPATMEMRKALAADFVRLFSCWCLALPPVGAHMSLKGPYAHAFFTTKPAAARRCCASCRIRRLPLEGDCALCDLCQSLADTKSTTETSDEPIPALRVDEHIRRYQERARFVGCSVLLLPGDPLLEEETKTLSNLHLELDHCGRPFEFLVASYLPSSLKDCGENDDLGVFYLLPVVNQRQMEYLLKRCKFRQPVHDDGLQEETIHSWRRDGLLDVMGVLQLSFKQLTTKVEATARIIDAVSNEVAIQSRCTCEAMVQLERCFEEAPQHESDEDGGEQIIPCTSSRCGACAEPDTAAFNTINSSFLIDTGFRASLPVMAEIVHPKIGVNSPGGDVNQTETSGPKFIAEDRMIPEHPQANDKPFLSTPPNISNQGMSVVRSLIYSDLYFGSQKEKLRFESSAADALENQNLKHKRKMTVVLAMHADAIGVTGGSTFNGWGWGFELFFFKKEGVVRVGRVNEDGIAFASGLRSGDQLVSVNGKLIAKFGSAFNLACALLPAPATMPRRQGTHIRKWLRWIATEQLRLGPLILEVKRAMSHDAETDESANHQRASQPHLITPSGRLNPNGAEAAVCTSTDFPWIYESFQHLEDYFKQSTKLLSEGDLYTPYLGGLLTVAETSVFMTAVAEGKPMLGVRLLVPRYNVPTIFSYLELFTQADFATFHRLSPALWKHLLGEDFCRAQQEDQNAPMIFFDATEQGQCGYRLPTTRFPIDRLCDDFFLGSRSARLQAPTVPGRSFQAPTGLRPWTQARAVSEASNDTPEPVPRPSIQEPDAGLGSSMRTLTTTTAETAKEAPPGPMRTGKNDMLNVGELPHVSMADTMDSATNTEEADGVPERIRGGGRSKDGGQHGSRKYLIDISQSEWNNTLVKGKCKTTLEGEKKAFFGRVKFREGTWTADAKVDVRVFHLERRGPIANQDIQGHPSKLTVVSESSSDGIIALNSERMMKSKEASESGNVSPMGLSMQEGPQESRLERAAMSSLSKTSALLHVENRKKKDANELVGELCRSTSTCPLGFLPDGRPLFWFRSDPRAVYVAPSSAMIQDNPASELELSREIHKYVTNVQKNFEQHSDSNLAVLRPSQPGTYSCIWGCSVTSQHGFGSCLSFDSIAQLRDHLRVHHSYVKDDESAVILDHSGTSLVRAPNLATITRICRGLAAAACAQCSPLRLFADPLNEYVIFSGDRLFSDATREQVKQSMADKSALDSSLLSLYRKLALLFPLAGDETYGLCNDEMMGAIALCHGKADHQDDVPLVDPCCCRLGCERILMTENDEYRDTGCLPVGDVCLDEKEDYPTECGDASIGDAKSMLLALASKIPEAIRRKVESDSQVNTNMGTTDPCHLSLSSQMQLWSDKGSESWRLFVLGSHDVRSLVQAFVVLLFSIDAELPEWWESEGLGWSALQVQATGSVSSLLFHLQVFEAALTEYISGACTPFTDTKQHVPADLASLPFDCQVSMTLKHAKEIGLSRFKGDYNFFCSICEDGGDIMCCELCRNVGHASCYKLSDEYAKANDFVCYACMTDVADMYSKLLRGG